MLRTAEIDIADSNTLDDVDVFLDNAAWADCFIYHTVLNSFTTMGAYTRHLFVGLCKFVVSLPILAGSAS
jgi:hypothetical protein